MPSQKQTTLCQACGAFVPTDEMPLHVSKHVSATSQRPFDADDVVEYTSGNLLDVSPVEQAIDSHLAINFYGPDTTEALERTARNLERGDAIAELLEAVTCGATLEVQGPKHDRSEVQAWIESTAGTRTAHASGDAIGPVLVELAQRWKRSVSTLPSPPPDPEERVVK